MAEKSTQIKAIHENTVIFAVLKHNLSINVPILEKNQVNQKIN